jgi:hypothetical protein
MPSTSRLLIVVLAVGLAFALRHAAAPGQRGFAAQPEPVKLTDETRRAGFTFAPGTAPSDQDLVVATIAAARPEAQRLIAKVDGLVTIRICGVEGRGADAVGLASGGPSGFTVTLDMGRVWSDAGQRGIARLILHELGHVVDSVLVPGPLEQALDAQVPAGYGCDPGQPTGSCAPQPERFAETFAKWATGDIGVNLFIGYKVLPPDSLEAWGAALVAGATGG